jgi:hypothetical protein
LIFKNFKEFKKAIIYMLKPDIVSIIQKDYDNDFYYTHKMLFILVIMFVVLLIEAKFLSPIL